MDFDICLVDMAMPRMDGLAFIEQVKKRAELKHIPIVVVSGSCSDETGSQAIEAGAADYLSKPAQIEVLKARISYCLRSSEQRRQELSRFLPSHIANALLRDDSVLTRPKFCDISVMVCDIRGFSRICETRHPGDTIRWISDVMNSLSEIILRSGGTIVDYVGDEIMAMWAAGTASEPRCRNRHPQRLGGMWKYRIETQGQIWSTGKHSESSKPCSRNNQISQKPYPSDQRHEEQNQSSSHLATSLPDSSQQSQGAC